MEALTDTAGKGASQEKKWVPRDVHDLCGERAGYGGGGGGVV